MNRKTVLAIFGFVALGTSIATSFVAYSQSTDQKVLDQIQIQDKERALYKKIIENGDPVANFNESEADTPKERIIRQSKNSRKEGRARPDTLDRQRGTINIGEIISHVVKPAFPRESDLVVVGVVNKAEAHVSPDKTDIFSQFDFQIGRIIKNATSENYQQGNSIILTRAGGKVLLPDGRTYYLGEDGKHMPKQGREYVMFLKSDNESPAYEILAAYAVNNGKVESLDGISLLYEGEPLSSYKYRLQFNGADINEFLNISVREVGTNN